MANDSLKKFGKNYNVEFMTNNWSKKDADLYLATYCTADSYELYVIARSMDELNAPSFVDDVYFDEFAFQEELSNVLEEIQERRTIGSTYRVVADDDIMEMIDDILSDLI